MTDWALFWMLLFAVAVLLGGWLAYLLEHQRRIERHGRLWWKRECMAAWARERAPEPDDIGSE